MDFIVYKPVWKHCSAGVRALYILEDKLQGLGHTINSKNPNAIVIYPEKVDGNPLNAKRVVRWMLNTPKYWGREYHYEKSEMFVAYKPYLIPEIDTEVHSCMAVNTIEPWLFYNDPNTEKTESVIYIGKCREKEVALSSPEEAKKIITITKLYPPTREATAELLRRTKNLYSLDDRTAILEEAFMCGCNVWLGKKKITIDDIETHPKHGDDSQIVNFVEKCKQFFNISDEEPQNSINLSKREEPRWTVSVAG